MNVSTIFIKRPVATTLLTLGIALSGALAFYKLPVAPLPAISFPTIQVQASMAGASPDTMAATVAEPLERHLGEISDVTEMTSESGVGSTRITVQFGLDRNIDGAARDVEAAIQAARDDPRPSLIAVRTHIGYGSPNKQDSHTSHGSALGEEEVRLVKEAYGWDPDAHFLEPAPAVEHFRRAIPEGEALGGAWE